MEQINDHRIEQCLRDIQKYEKWGNLLAGQSLAHLFNSNSPISVSAIHNGFKCGNLGVKYGNLRVKCGNLGRRKCGNPY